jgi:hypothetical protein
MDRLKQHLKALEKDVVGEVSNRLPSLWFQLPFSQTELPDALQNIAIPAMNTLCAHHIFRL